MNNHVYFLPRQLQQLHFGLQIFQTYCCKQEEKKKMQRLHPSPTGMFVSNPVGSPAVEADRGGNPPANPPRDWQHNTYINALNVLTVFS